MPLRAGAKLGPYEIVSAIGKGGMGDVYRARDPRLSRDVAIKVSAARFSERFEREAKAIAALNHPNICQIYDVGPDYIVMEYIDGAPPRGPLATAEVVRLALGIAAALEAAHGKGITHRDLKPANILVTQSGLQSSVKLLDFGLALVNDNSGIDIADAPTALSVAGAVMGTVAYMSPEQAQGRPADARSDIFSFGLLLYEMLSGRQAFAGNSAVETMAAIIREEPPSLDAPAKLSEIVTRCLRKAPASRFQTMSEVRAALEQVTATAASNTPSIAVLPFANMSRSPDDEYFSDGLAEEILNVLAHIRGLKVIARTSSFAFRGKEQDITKIAEALRVQTILEGSVRRAGSRIRVTAQLISAEDGSHLWSERYDREMTDVFAIQDEIAASIAGALRLKLTGQPAPARQHQPNLPAYEALLKGRHQIARITPEGFARGRKYYEQAIALDPEFAEPHAGLGGYFVNLAISGLQPAGEVMPQARAEAGRALEISHSDPTAHAVLCFVASTYDYDWGEAQRHYREATAADSLPPSARVLAAFAYLLPLGRFEEAMREIGTAIEQDPLNVTARNILSATLRAAGFYDRSVAEARKAVEIDEHHWAPHFYVSLGLACQGMFAEAREPAERAFKAASWHPQVLGLLAGIFARLGQKERADELLAKIPEAGPGGRVLYHLLCAEIDGTADWYEKAIELRDPFAVVWSAVEFAKPLRSSPRWARLAKMMNLP